jgi:dolichyl-diphosphooligosaccharide--protein glycosyltransferase
MISRIFFYFMFFFAIYINKQLAYFTQISSFFAIIGGGVGIADLTAGGLSSTRGKKEKARRSKREVADPIKIMAGIFIVLVVSLSAVYYGYNSYKQNSYRAPQILTSGLGALRSGNETIVPLNNAWLNAFAWIRNNTREDSVIVSWWDYGYWITVNTDRRTVADGVTFNETQIRWLAEVLTGNESTALYLLKNKFKAEPGNTYIVFYEVFNGIYDKVNKTIIMYPILGQAYRPRDLGETGIIIHGTADFGKSIQMLRISYRIDPFDPRAPFDTVYSSFYVDTFGYKYKHFPGFVGEPEENVTTVMHTLIYQMAFNGIIAIRSSGVFDGERCQEIFNNSLVLPYAISSLSGGGQLQPVYTHLAPLKYFKPAAISVSCPIIKDMPGGTRTTFTSVIVFIFEFTG